MKKNYIYTLIILIGLLVSGFIVRSINLTYLPVFADEAIYVRWSQVMGHEPTLRFLPLSDGKQPFFMWILMFAVSRFSDPLFAGRFLSVMTGTGTILGVFSISYLLFKSKKAAIFSALITSICPFLVFFDRMALVDSMLTFWGTWAIFFSIITAKTKRIDAALFTGFCLGFAWLTKSPAIFLILLSPLSFIISFDRKNIYKFGFQFFVLNLISSIIAFAMYNILRLGPNFNLINSRNLDYVYPISHLFSSPLDPFVSQIDRSFEWIRIWGPAPVLILAIFSLVVFLKQKRNISENVFLFILFITPIVMESAIAKVFTARYILFTIPYLIILAGNSILINLRYFKYIFYISVLVLLISSFVTIFNFWTDLERAAIPRSERSGYLEEWTAGNGIKQISEYIKDLHVKNPDKQIVVGTEGYFGTLPDGLQMYLDQLNSVIVVGIGLNIHEVPKPLAESRDAGNLTFLVINDSRFTYTGDPSELGLNLIASYKKATRPPFVREYVQHGSNEHLLFFEVLK